MKASEKIREELSECQRAVASSLHSDTAQLISARAAALHWALELVEAQEKADEWTPLSSDLPREPGTYEFLAHELNIHVFEATKKKNFFVLAGLGDVFDARTMELQDRYTHWRPVTLPQPTEAAGADRRG